MNSTKRATAGKARDAIRSVSGSVVLALADMDEAEDHDAGVFGQPHQRFQRPSDLGILVGVEPRVQARDEGVEDHAAPRRWRR